jgi:N6-adenosine-specific RNA methylase IME4
MEFHPLANIFPLMEGGAFDALVADITQNGIRDPLVAYEDMILDGRNRWRAAERAGITITAKLVKQFNPEREGDPLEWVISKNLQRRHLDESQRAMVGSKLETFEHGGDRKSSDQDAIWHLDRDAVARMLNVSERSIARARVVRDSSNPNLIDLVEHGRVNVSRAAAIVKHPESFQHSVVAKIESGMKPTEALRQARREALPDKVAQLPVGKHRVIYIDPPWQYNDARQTGDHRESTGAIHHFSTMTLDELKLLDVKSLAADNCVLLLWAVFPMLPEALDLVKALGFKYKTAFVWDKGHGAFGSYHDAEAELLIIATIGSCVPEADQKEKQIQRFARSAHSRKPEEWRSLIDKLWPNGARVELFRRGDVPAGWTTWGAEAEQSEAAA